MGVHFFLSAPRCFGTIFVDYTGMVISESYDSFLRILVIGRAMVFSGVCKGPHVQKLSMSNSPDTVSSTRTLPVRFCPTLPSSSKSEFLKRLLIYSLVRTPR